MKGLNLSRWLLGGVVAGMVFFVLEGLASGLYIDQMTASMQAANLEMNMGVTEVVTAVLVSLISGLTLVFIYASIRPRFGPGPRTALIAAFILFFGSLVVSLLGYKMIGLFPDPLLIQWGLIGLLEMLLSSLAGAWLYREA